MATARWPLQQAIYAKLSAMSLAPVLDDVPDSQPYPYVSFGAILEDPADAHNQRGIDALVSLHVWSKAEGYREADAIFAELDALLDRQPLVVTGWTDVSIALDDSSAVRDPDPNIRHISARYRVWLTKE